LNTPDNGITPSFYLHSGVPAGIAPASPVLDATFGAVKVGQNATTSIQYFDTNRRTGYSQQFNLGVQRELPHSLMLEVSLIGNLSRKLPSTAINIDQILPQLLGPNCDTQACRPYPQFSGVSILAPTLGVSNYYAGILRAEKRFAGGLSFLATYTYSKFLLNTNDGGSTLGSEGGLYSNYYNRAADYGPSGNDIRSRFTFSEVYQLPFGKGGRWLTNGPFGAVAGGWSIGSVTTVQSGPPFTVTTQTNNTSAFSAGAQRANVVGSPAGPQTVAEWFNTSAFAPARHVSVRQRGRRHPARTGAVQCRYLDPSRFPRSGRLAAASPRRVPELLQSHQSRTPRSFPGSVRLRCNLVGRAGARSAIGHEWCSDK
jgi:hypothetical protein